MQIYSILAVLYKINLLHCGCCLYISDDVVDCENHAHYTFVAIDRVSSVIRNIIRLL